MNRRAECRRRRRYAAKGRVDPRLHDRLEPQRVLPKGHPNRDDGPLMSSRAQGMRLLDFVRRSKVAPLIQLRLNGLIDRENDMRLLGPRPGPKSMVTVEMMLLGILIAADIKKSYRRTDISRVLIGLHADIALAVASSMKTTTWSCRPTRCWQSSFCVWSALWVKDGRASRGGR